MTGRACHRYHRPVTSKAAVSMLLFLVACTNSGASAVPSTSVPPAGLTAVTPVTTGPVSRAAPEPTGVPGLDAPDRFCAAWAGYAGTLQALSIAASFGGLSSASMAALELAAAPWLAKMVEQIDATWPAAPADVAAEHDVAMDRKVGPYVRRADHAIAALRDAGLTDDELSVLSGAWQKALVERDPQAAVIDVPSVGDLQQRVDVAAAAFDSATTPFAQDPSLTTTDAATPATDAYLAAHCPDLATSGVGDAI
jgi:hypothetical protein